MVAEIGRYRNLQPIGRGGMGEIFRADDPALHRAVALKFVAPGQLDETSRLRLVREARAAAALSHPFVCTIHEVLESEGQPVIVMELVSGQTLHDRLRSGPLPLADIARIGGEILEALSAAHDRGITHRDIKSGNVMLTADGHVKVMDFGLAMTAPAPESESTVQRMTAAGAVAGTVTHMAPELLLGGIADALTDLYAFGVTLYEMCAGRLPFLGSSHASLIGEVLGGSARPPASCNPAIPPPLDEFVMRLIDKERARRPATARSALEALRRACEPVSNVPGGGCSIAVLPFRTLVADADTEMLSMALADATIAELSMLRSMTVRPTAAVLRYLMGSVDPTAAGRELGVDAVVHGTFQRSGSRLRVTVQLVRTAEARSIWATKIDTSLDDIFATQDEVSRKIAAALDVELSPADAKRMARVERPAGAAYEHYVRGQLHLLHETLPDTNAAIDAFRKAVEIDPRFAPAWAALAEAYIILGYSFDPNPEWFRSAAELTERALSLDPRLPEGRYLQGRLIWNPASGFDHAGAIRHFAAAIAGNPNLAQAHDWMSAVLNHVGLLNESRMHVRRAMDIAPGDMNAITTEGFFLLFEGRYDEALVIAERLARAGPSPGANYLVANIRLRQPRYELAQEVAERSAREFPNDAYFHPVRAMLAAARGDEPGMRSAIEATLANSHAYGHYHHAQYDIACAYALAGNATEAVRWLDDAAGNGLPCAPLIEVDPLFDRVRAEPEVQELLNRLRKELAEYAIVYRDAMTRPYSDSGS